MTLTKRRVRELRAARDWQIAQAWSDVRAIADGGRAFGSWEEIEQAAERARLRIKEREALTSVRRPERLRP